MPSATVHATILPVPTGKQDERTDEYKTQGGERTSSNNSPHRLRHTATVERGQLRVQFETHALPRYVWDYQDSDPAVVKEPPSPTNGGAWVGIRRIFQKVVDKVLRRQPSDESFVCQSAREVESR